MFAQRNEKIHNCCSLNSSPYDVQNKQNFCKTLVKLNITKKLHRRVTQHLTQRHWTFVKGQKNYRILQFGCIIKTD